MAGPSRPPRPRHLQTLSESAVLQVEMQMGAVDVVGFRAEHRGEHLAGALMHAPQELGLRQRERIRRRSFARELRIALNEGGRLDRGLHGSRPARRLCRHLVGGRILIGSAARAGVFGDDRNELHAGDEVPARRAPAGGEIDPPSIGEIEHRKVDGVGVGVLAAALVGQVVEVAAGIA